VAAGHLIEVSDVTDAVPERVSIRASFERFPATVKGAFVLRGADRDPHQVRIDAARVREISGRSAAPIGLDPVTLDVAPNLDLFVPFEFGITELTAGWYGLECDVAIDGDPENVRPPKRFAVPWPRATVRRGSVTVNKNARIENGPRVHVEQVECGGESIRVTYTTTPPEALPVQLAADGSALTVLDSEFDMESGRGRVTAYPVMRTQSTLTIDIRGLPTPIQLDLP
jgi:hypothetical protein